MTRIQCPATPARLLRLPRSSKVPLPRPRPGTLLHATAVMMALALPIACLSSSSPSDSGPATAASSDWILVPAGTYTMGCTAGQGGCQVDEVPTTEVTLTRAFYLSPVEVTQQDYEDLSGTNPSAFDGCAECPVESLTWLEAIDFANALSRLEGDEPCYLVDAGSVTWPDGAACTGYRLPTEAEREYAARAGTDTRYAGSDTLDDVAWTGANSDGQTHPVGLKTPNDWGLYDMTGNVNEWTWDWYGPYPGGSAADPVGLEHGEERTFRGGSWNNVDAIVRVANRGRNPADEPFAGLGLRLARTAP